MSILDKKKLQEAESPSEFMRIIDQAPDGLIIGKKLKKDGIEIKYEYSEKMKELFEFHGIDIDYEYETLFDTLKDNFGNEDDTEEF